MHPFAHVKAAGQMAQHVDAAGACDGLADAVGHLLAIQQVDLGQLGVRDAAVVLTQRARVAIQQHQPRALAGEVGHHGGAQVAGGAGDENGGAGFGHGAACARLSAW